MNNGLSMSRAEAVSLGFDWNVARQAAKVTDIFGPGNLKAFGKAINARVPSVPLRSRAESVFWQLGHRRFSTQRSGTIISQDDTSEGQIKPVILPQSNGAFLRL